MLRCAACLGRGDEEAALAVLDLQRDAADVAADRRPSLPQRLGHRQPEALADRLLDRDVGLRLEGVDLDRPDVVEVVEDLDVGVGVGVLEGVVEELPALGVVGRHRADQRELDARGLLLDHPVGVDHAHRVLPGIEARDLADQRPVDVDAELVADEGGVVGRQRHVLRRERVDRRRHDVARRRASSPPGTYCSMCQTVRRTRRSAAAAARSAPGSAPRGRCGSARSRPWRGPRRRVARRPAEGRGR